MTKGITETLAKLAPGRSILGAQPGNRDTGTATQAAAGLFTKYGNQIIGVHAAEDIMMQRVLIAAERADLDATSMGMIGGGCEPVGSRDIKAGLQYGTVLQSPVDIASHAAQSLIDLFSGAEMAKSVYVPHPMVTAANVDVRAWDQPRPWKLLGSTSSIRRLKRGKGWRSRIAAAQSGRLIARRPSGVVALNSACPATALVA